MQTPAEILRKIKIDYPELNAQIDSFRKGRGNGLPDWPSWCFLPMAAWYAIASGGGDLPLHKAGEVSKLAALGSWQYTKGIYKFDAMIQSALSESVVSGDMPSEILMRLPEFCLFVENQAEYFNTQTSGFFASLEYDIKTHGKELRLLFVTEDILIPVPVHIGNHTVTEAVQKALIVAQQNAGSYQIKNDEVMLEMSNAANQAISLLLYICSEAPDIVNKQYPEAKPARPQPKKIKGDWRLFAAQKETVWRVGEVQGEKLRQAKASAEQSSTGSAKAPHVRRGHWHGFWTGAGREKFVHRWIAPTFINAGD